MNNNQKDYSELRGYLVKAQQTGLNVGELLRQLDQAVESGQSSTIKIVLLGSVSDGKTTTIAGVMGREEGNMKIDIDESSDELTFYHLPALGKEFEIVDTPGMFGTKEREINGEIVKYSDITRQYIANAHILIYVSSAVNPVKDSHEQALRFVLRELGKLPNTIFVINKLDEAGCTLSDMEEYRRVSKIKRDTLVKRLNGMIGLSPAEERNLRVCCIAAAPNGRGLKFWLEKGDIYLERSHIEDLRTEIGRMAKSIDKNAVKENVNLGVVKDIVLNFLKSFVRFQKDNKNPLEILEEKYDEMRNKYNRLRAGAIQKKGLLQQELQNLQFEIETSISNASMEDFSSVVNKYIGSNGDRLERSINQLFSYYAEQNKANFEKSKIQNDFEKSSELFNQTLKWGGGILKNAKFSADTIKTLRNILAPAFKFKPWQAVKWAGNLSKWLGWIGAGLHLLSAFRNWRERKKFEETKGKMLADLRKLFSKCESDYLNSEEAYFTNFAPYVPEIERRLKEMESNIAKIKDTVASAARLRDDLLSWYGGPIEDVEYEEVNF